MKIIFLAILIISFSSCKFFKKGNEMQKEPVARVDEEYLYTTNIKNIVSKGTDKADSILIIDNYIQSWIKEKLILQKAELNLEESKKDFSKQLEDYRKSLIIYSYEKELIKQRLDTNVSEKEIEEYYEKNKQNFELKNDIVKVRYIKLLRAAPKINKIRKIYTSEKQKEIKKLKEFSHQYAEKFFLNDSLWITFDELQKEVPLKISQTEEYLKNVKNIEVEDSLSFYFVNIRDYRLKHDISPLSFENDNIRNIILNKRKLKLINQIQTDIYQQAFINKSIEIYNKRND